MLVHNYTCLKVQVYILLKTLYQTIFLIFLSNVQARVSGIMTNAPLMLNVDCDMYANNPQVFLHAMCMVFGFKNEENIAFFQFPQAFYDGLKDDPFGNQLAHLYVRMFGLIFCS